MKETVSALKLYIIFLKIGAILFGGGYVILPILTSELCEKRNLIKESELVDYFALAQSLPGIVAANISMFTGYKLCGKRGAITAMLGIITVPFLIIALLASLLGKLTNNLYMNGIFSGINIAVIALILLTIREIWQKTNRNLFFYIIFITSLIALIYLKFSAVKVIIIFSLFGILLKTFEAKRRSK